MFSKLEGDYWSLESIYMVSTSPDLINSHNAKVKLNWPLLSIIQCINLFSNSNYAWIRNGSINLIKNKD